MRVYVRTCSFVYITASYFARTAIYLNIFCQPCTGHETKYEKSVQIYHGKKFKCKYVYPDIISKVYHRNNNYRKHYIPILEYEDSCIPRTFLVYNHILTIFQNGILALQSLFRTSKRRIYQSYFLCVLKLLTRNLHYVNIAIITRKNATSSAFRTIHFALCNVKCPLAIHLGTLQYMDGILS